ncbi:hypothetical protein HZC00_03055 [Candidatus Kaiserbacteria bacterium]|nr:hypothetical protein [Candidatus Kaiserbacteria bacterium]
MKEAYAQLSIGQAQDAIHTIILEVYKGPNPSKEKVNAALMNRFGIRLLENGFRVTKIDRGNGDFEVRCIFKAPAPDGKSFLGIWV